MCFKQPLSPKSQSESVLTALWANEWGMILQWGCTMSVETMRIIDKSFIKNQRES